MSCFELDPGNFAPTQVPNQTVQTVYFLRHDGFNKELQLGSITDEHVLKIPEKKIGFFFRTHVQFNFAVIIHDIRKMTFLDLEYAWIL